MDQEAINRALRLDLSRRGFLKASMLGAVGVGVAACGGTSVVSGGGKGKSPIVANVQTGDLATAERQCWVGPFEKTTGIPVITDERNITSDIVELMISTGQVTVDVLTSIPNGIDSADYPKFFEPLDFSLIDKSQFLPQFIGDTWVGVDIYSTVCSWNTKALEAAGNPSGKVPASWSDVFDLQAFKGKRSCEDYWATTCTVALLADGVAPADLLPMDIDRAIAKLNTIKSEIVLYETGSDVQSFLTTGEVALGMSYNGRTAAASAAGAPVGSAWAQQLVAMDQGGVIKGTSQRAEAMQFLAYVTGAAHGGALTAYFPYPPANTKAAVDAATEMWLPSQHFDQPYVVLNQDYLNDNFNQFDPKFEAWKTTL
jgi:putative spermidine/putrescine transport system substrate-binding protein